MDKPFGDQLRSNVDEYRNRYKPTDDSIIEEIKSEAVKSSP